MLGFLVVAIKAELGGAITNFEGKTNQRISIANFNGTSVYSRLNISIRRIIGDDIRH